MARRLAFDRVLFAVVVILTFLGLVMVYSTTAALAGKRELSVNTFFLKQLAAAVLGFVAMLVAMHIDYRRLRERPVIYAMVAVVVVLLVAVLFTNPLNNTRRWLFLAGVSVQPSELAKLVLIVFMAYQIERKVDRVNSFALLVPCAFVTATLAALVVLGRDLGTTVLLTLPPLVMLFLAGISTRFLVLGAAMLGPLIALAITFESYRFKRLTAFLDPEADPLGIGFQALQSLIAVGSGGLFGLGPGNSLQKLYFLPSPHADFIYAIIAEELGLLGAVAVVVLFAVLLWRGVLAGLHAPDTFGSYLAWGLTAMLVGQALIHVSVTLSLVPTTGVPLPLISHGGSSLVTTLVACGLLLNVSQHGG
jgi:cell division protein FtsW